MSPALHLSSVVAPPAVLRALLSAHDGAGPGEPCAALIGTVDAGRLRVLEVRPLPNVHPDPARAFSVDPVGLLAAAKEARERGAALVGAWHGHPNGVADLSRADVAGLSAAAGAPFVYVVSGRGAGRNVVLRAFAADAGGFPYEVAVMAARA